MSQPEPSRPSTSPNLPPSASPTLTLAHPTPSETTQIWHLTAPMWSDALPTPIYMEEQAHLATAPLAIDKMTTWILVDASQSPDDRQVLCSCETYRKCALTSDGSGNVEEGIVHGVASVFTPVEHRGKGYAARMLKDLAKVLYTWQRENGRCVGSILYSDIGPTYYAKLGWIPTTSNTHIALKPSSTAWPDSAKPINRRDLADLCTRDEALMRKAMASPSPDNLVRMTIIPDVDHMLWHHAKADFACEYLFNKTPLFKGAIAGEPGDQVWVVWTHRYCSPLDAENLPGNNTLYILRLVIEPDPKASQLPSPADKLPSQDLYNKILSGVKTVLQAAQAEAAEWKLDTIELWDPTPLVKNVLGKSGLEYTVVEREAEHMASLLWYDKDGGGFGNGTSTPAPLWVGCEHYAWM
ncbi:hypothetical protein K458DRAFT_424768 [Lentithecium fluviatile CBS 122367]|uniref:LYC1 C-terminal domain-containing protein n=1 Tax=Lentithecium fluviatile CBS 122367 TaxID=1168545 RepID=A0A6G1IE88_9PLEO|nr:hypothetical protein K458DRAFT_424768 [Lentithecium fluviatile CBS 122367]